MDMFEPTNRDWAQNLIGDFDLEAQLMAIKAHVKRNMETDKILRKDIKELEAECRERNGGHYEYLESLWLERLEESVFQNAAHSMASVGMLAPFIESLFVSIFEGLRKNRNRPYDGLPGVRGCAINTEYWDPHYVYGNGGRHKDIVNGIIQLAESTGLRTFLPDCLNETLSALFVYRNKMFHNGFEWPVEERKKFETTINDKKWPPSWFNRSTSDGDPRIFYMSPDFIQHCLATVDNVLEGVGKFHKKELDIESNSERLI